jgi:two-component system NarL family sensor kinase
VVISAEERERQAVADALHDGAVQNLLAARHELDEVSGQVESPALVRADAALEETVRDLREALFELHPYVLEAAGLEAALAAAGERAARQGRFRLHLDARPVGRSPHERLLLSAVRELLVNVAKHAEATDVAISLRERDGHLVLSIRDDGNGFDEALLPQRLAEGHLGLASQKARLERVGGDLVIESAVGRGTSAEIRVPRT